MPAFAYPADFATKVKAIFPNWTRLHEHLDAGSVIVGRYLDDVRRNQVPSSRVLELLDAGDLSTLRKEAEEPLAADSLYSEWCTRFQPQFFPR